VANFGHQDKESVLHIFC